MVLVNFLTIKCSSAELVQDLESVALTRLHIPPAALLLVVMQTVGSVIWCAVLPLSMTATYQVHVIHLMALAVLKFREVMVRLVIVFRMVNVVKEFVDYLQIC